MHTDNIEARATHPGGSGHGVSANAENVPNRRSSVRQ